MYIYIYIIYTHAKAHTSKYKFDSVGWYPDPSVPDYDPVIALLVQAAADRFPFNVSQAEQRGVPVIRALGSGSLLLGGGCGMAVCGGPALWGPHPGP